MVGNRSRKPGWCKSQGFDSSALLSFSPTFRAHVSRATMDGCLLPFAILLCPAALALWMKSLSIG